MRKGPVTLGALASTGSVVEPGGDSLPMARSLTWRVGSPGALAVVCLSLLGCGDADAVARAEIPPGSDGCLEAESGRRCYVLRDGFAITDDDIIIGTAEQVRPGRIQQALSLAGGSRRWTANVVPYVIKEGFSGAALQRIDEAMRAYAASAEVRWLPRSRQADYVEIVPTGPNGKCDSWLGRQGGAQVLHLDSNAACAFAHEMGHALGMDHEHQRPDRDAHIRVLLANIKPEHQQWYAARRAACTSLPYDTDSVMHYASLGTFGVDSQRPTLTRLDGALIPYRATLSSGDIAGLRYHYPKTQDDQRWGLVDLGGWGFAQWRTNSNGCSPREQLRARAWHLDNGGLQPAAWTGLNAAMELYAEGDNNGPFGLVSLGARGVLQWRTDNEGAAPRHFLMARARLLSGGGQLTQAGPWTRLNRAEDLYAEGDNSGPFGLVSLGARGVLQWRTDNEGAALRHYVQVRPWLLDDRGQLTQPAPWAWVRLNGANDLYAEGDNQGPWGLVSLGARGFVQWRTDNEGGAPRRYLMVRPWLLDAQGQLTQGAGWTRLNGADDLFAEGDNQGPWGLVSLGESGLAQWRTDNEGGAPRRYLMVRPWLLDAQGQLTQSGPWTRLNDARDLFAEGDNGGPFGLLGLGASGVLQWRTDDTYQRVRFRSCLRQADQRFSCGSWSATSDYYPE